MLIASVYAACYIFHLECDSSLLWRPKVTEIGLGAAKWPLEQFDCIKDTVCCSMLEMWGIHNSCFLCSFERNEIHKASKDKLNPKSLGDHLYLLPCLHVLIKAELKSRSGCHYDMVFIIKTVNVGPNWMWLLNVMGRTQGKSKIPLLLIDLKVFLQKNSSQAGRIAWAAERVLQRWVPMILLPTLLQRSWKTR